MRIKLFILSIFLLLSSGCTVVYVGGAAVVGGTYYISGEIRSSYPVSIYHLYEVSLYTFQKEGIETTSVKNTRISADIEGVLLDGEKIKIHIFYNEKDEAAIGIRIGGFGDEKRSRDMLKRMEEYI